MFLDDMVSLLVTAGVGVAGTSIFWSSGAILPPVNSAVAVTGYLSLLETGGTAPILMHSSDTTPGYQRPDAQITARAKSYTAARALAKLAYGVFVQRRMLTVNGIYYVSIDVIQEPFDLGPDASGLIRSAFNIRAIKRPS